MKNRVYLNRELQDDNLFAPVEIVPTKDLVGYPTASKIAQTVISNGKAVATCSPTYGLLTNVEFFGRMEHELIEEGIQYSRRAFNHNDARFYTDYVLNDDSKVITVLDSKNNGIDDTIVPMIRLTNSYDGSVKSAGYLGFFRKICENGMHMTHTQIEFSVRHTKGNMEVFIPKIGDLVKKFMDNEMFSITDKIQKMKTHFIDERKLEEWIKQLALEERVFVPTNVSRAKGKEGVETESINAKLVKDIIIRDSLVTNTEPNAWLVYSAFNEFIHSTASKVFIDQKKMDVAVFENVSQLVTR